MFELGNIGSYMKSGYNAMEQGVLGIADDVKKSKVGALWDTMSGPSDDELGMMADNEADGAVGTGEEALAKAQKDLGTGMDFDKMSKVLASVKPVEGPKVSQASHRGGGFNYNSKLYENPLLTREYQSLYSQPLYNKLT